MACRSVLQDKQIFMNDFEKSVTGNAHLLPAAPRRQALFIPESLVEKIPNQVESSLILSPQQLAAEKKAYEKAEKDKIFTDDKASIEALVVTDRSINITERQEAYKKLQAKSRSNVEDDVSHGRNPVSQGHDLGKGSRIQIPAPDSTHPMQYGTIKWTGLLPHAVGEIAGIELVK